MTWGRRPASLPVFGVGLALVLAGVLGWAANELFSAPEASDPAPAFTTTKVRSGSVSRSISLGASASWSGGRAVLGHKSGTVTRVLVAGREVAPGDTIYEVDLAPVVVARGRVPAFRELSAGARGPDVRQLQELLVDLGFRSSEPDGFYGGATTREVAAWQGAAARPATGRVALGDVLFVPRLPRPIAPGAALQVGALAPMREVAVRALPVTPRFQMTLPVGQAALVDTDQPVELRFRGATWKAKIGELSPPSPDGVVTASLVPSDGKGTVCGDQCASVPAAGTSSIQATVVIVPEQHGLIVPTAALMALPDGTAQVVRGDGESIQVRVLAAASGNALVEGVAEGDDVRVPGGTP